MRSALQKIIDFFRENTVLVQFYVLIGLFFIAFYSMLQWKISHELIATHLPILMADNVAWGLRLVGVDAVAKVEDMPGTPAVAGQDLGHRSPNRLR